MSQKIYEIVTAAITAKLEAGTCPWQMPWAKMGTAPRNIKGNTYRGCNFFLLSMMGFSDPTFMTFKQAAALGGTVKKGEKGVPVIFWTFMEDKKSGEKFPMIKYYTVFNISQTEGVKYTAPVVPDNTFTGIEAAEAIVNGFENPPTVNHGGDRAAYNRAQDRIVMPLKAQFTTEGEYYSTLFHELGHSTGHDKRLNRKELCSDGFGSENYSLEELTAELTAAFLCAEAGIDGTINNSAAYIKGWLMKLKEDPKIFVQAAGKAQKAANFILGVKAEEKKEEVEAA